MTRQDRSRTAVADGVGRAAAGQALDPALRRGHGAPGAVVVAAASEAARRRVDLPFAERFEILDHLGSGSYAEVYLAADRARGERVALKVLHDRVSDSAVWPARERFEREVVLMQRLGHPGVVPVLDSGYLPDARVPGRVNPALTMPVVDGETLAAVLERREAQPVAEVVRFLEAVVGVLVHLQEHGVVHRDLGPQNVFRTRDGRFVVSDFGLARPMDAAVVTRLSGTLTDAMAARLLYTDAANRDGVLTSASDLVSVCRVAIALLRGRHYTGPLMPSDAAAVPAALRALLNRHAADGAEGEPAAFLRELARAAVAGSAAPSGGPRAASQHEEAGRGGAGTGRTPAPVGAPMAVARPGGAAGHGEAGHGEHKGLSDGAAVALCGAIVVGLLGFAAWASTHGQRSVAQGVDPEASRYVIEQETVAEGSAARGSAALVAPSPRAMAEAQAAARTRAAVLAEGGSEAAVAAALARLPPGDPTREAAAAESVGTFRVRLRGVFEGGATRQAPAKFGERAAAAAAACGVTMAEARPIPADAPAGGPAGRPAGNGGAAMGGGPVGEAVRYTVPAPLRAARVALGRPLRIPYCAMAAGVVAPPPPPGVTLLAALGGPVSQEAVLADLRHRVELVAEAEGRFLAAHGAFADAATINAAAVAPGPVAIAVTVTPAGVDGVGEFRVTATRDDGDGRCEGTFVGTAALPRSGVEPRRPGGPGGLGGIGWDALAEAGARRPGRWTVTCGR